MISNRHRNYALFILTTTYVFNFLDRQLLAILVEPIKQEFGASDTAMGLLYGLAFSLFYATLAIPVARLADKNSRRNILAIAAGLWSAMTMLCGLASNFWQLLLLRIGVAVGEAGGVPPSQSLVNDYYPPEHRATAMAIFSSATFIGTILAMVGGALIAQKFGWRAAFIIVGAPGILLAIIIRFTIKEPQRGAWDQVSKNSNEPSLNAVQTFKVMWQSQALRYTIIGCGFAGLSGYGLGYWTPAFMMRVHSLSIVEAGVMIGGLGAISGLFGTLFGGKLCDKLARKDRKWLLLIPVISLLVSLPLMLLFLYWPETHTFRIANYDIPFALLIYIVAAFIGSWWAAPTYVVVQELVAPNQRTLACAILLFVMNLIGFGLGPLLVGVFSDLLEPNYRSNSVRYALMIIMLAYIAASAFYYRASKTFTQQIYSQQLTEGLK